MSMNPLDFLADLLLRWREKSSRTLIESAARLEREVSLLSMEQATQRAAELLRTGQHFRTVKSPLGQKDESLLAQLPPSVAKLFRDYSSIAATNGDQRISRDSVGPSEFRQGFLRIGYDMDSSEVAVRPGDEHLFVLTPNEEPEQEAPSVFHWLVLLERLSAK